jgi:hypothetical protein
MFDWIKEKYGYLDKDSVRFRTGSPNPIIRFENFLPETTAYKLYYESQSIPNAYWKTFDRNGSHMKELNNIELMPIGFELMNYLHSTSFLSYLTSLTGIERLIPDPHLIGAGYSKSYNRDTLQIHTDFNWNNELSLHRALSLIIYITPEWKAEYGGALSFLDRNRQEEIYKADCLFNSALLWRHGKYTFHGYKDPIQCPEYLSRNTFRIFYYVSSSEYDPNDPPHRSLYWYDEKLNEPIDIKK